MHPRVRKEVLLEGSTAQPTRSGGSKWIWVDFKGSLAEAIIPSSGTQPSTRLRRDGAFPCKVVITSTHALPQHPRGFPMVKSLKISTLNGRLKCTVNGVDASDNPRKLKQKMKHTSHTNIHETSSGLYRSSMIGLQSTSMCRSPPEYSQTSIWPVTRPYS